MKKIGQRETKNSIYDFYVGINREKMIKHGQEVSSKCKMMIVFVEESDVIAKAHEIPESDYMAIYEIPDGYKDYDFLKKWFNGVIDKYGGQNWHAPAGIQRGKISLKLK